MKKTVSKLLSLILVFSMLASLTITFALAGSSFRVAVNLPEETYGSEPAVTIDIYKGFPTSSNDSIEALVNAGKLEVVKADLGKDAVSIDEAGTYCYHVYGEGYYSILKLFNVTKDDISGGVTKELEAEGGKVAGNGFEPCYKPDNAPETYSVDFRDSTLINWTDEILNHFKVEDQGYKTPAFDGKHAPNEFTSQDELMDFVTDVTENCDYMYLFSAGTTPNYGYDIPMVLITQVEIPAGATIEEAAELIRADGKTNVWYQSQIHPNEPASGEGSLVMLNNFKDKQEYRDYLDTINVIMVPRINPDGSYLFSRATYGGFDMNRDHTALKAKELADLHDKWYLFQTEVVVDTHEFTYYGATDTGAMSNAYDIETTPATTLNMDQDVVDIALDMCGEAFQAEKDAGMRVYHYGYTTNPPIGRCYFGLLDCLSFLIETRGIGAGRANFERRVRSQEVAATAYIDYAAKHAEEIKSAVADARAKLIESGKTYDPNSIFALQQTDSGNRMTEYVADQITYKLDGTENIKKKDVAMSINDTATRYRSRPTAYVLPADFENIEDVLYIMDHQGADYFKVPAGAAIDLQQYYYLGKETITPYPEYSFYKIDIEKADLRDETSVTFENGAYVFPMDQLAANVIASIFEPDLTDSAGYDGSLAQYGKMDYDSETNDYPLYRYIHDDPRALKAECRIVFDYPLNVPEDDVKITVFDGIPQWRQKNNAADVEDVIRVFTQPTNAAYPKLNVIEPNPDGSYTVDEAHGYSYLVRGVEKDEYYNIIKLFIVSDSDLLNGEKHVAVKTGPIAGTGFETGTNNPVGVNGERAPEGFNQGVQHMVPIEGTDEMEYLMGTDGLKDYVPFTTPAFTEGRAMYQATTQQEMMDFIADYADDCPYMHVYSMGTTSVYGYDYPLIVYTKKNIPASATMQEAAQILRNGGKPIVWQQAQIHPYEPASGESALVMIQELCGDYGKKVLNDIDVVLIPRVNVDGSFLFYRGDASGTDMNRDHMALTTEQNAMLHDAYYMFMPHVVIDNHEFFFSEMGNYNNNPEQFKLNDFQITGATSLNDEPEITDITTNIVVDKMHLDLLDYGFRPYHYGITSNNPIGRAYYGLGNAISVLIESHGADGALFAFPRRVYGQVIATKSVYESTVEHADLIMNAVNNARAKVAEKGKTYDEDDILVLKQSASGKVTSPTPLAENVADIYGNIFTTDKKTIALQDTVVRSRVRPTAYIVDGGVEWLDQLKYILTHQNIEFFMLEPDTTLALEQYYYIQKDGSKSCIADLRAKKKVSFPNGCLMIPMDQEVGNIIGMLMEPDVGDSSSYNGTLFQYGLLQYDANKNFPLYRYCEDNAREKLLDYASVTVTSASSAAVNTLTAKVKLTANTDIGGAVIGLSYGSGLTLTDVKGVDWEKGDANLVVNEEIAAGVTKTITLTFTVDAKGASTTVTAWLKDICAPDGGVIYCGPASSASCYVSGDTNGDGIVSVADLVNLRSYIGTNGEGAAVGSGADINRDGKVNGLDLTALHRYLASAAF